MSEYTMTWDPHSWYVHTLWKRLGGRLWLDMEPRWRLAYLLHRLGVEVRDDVGH